MGNSNNPTINSNTVNQILNEVNEKDKISKGTYEEKYNVKKIDSKEFYDWIINIDTFSQKPNIKWMIETKKNIPILIKDKKIEDNNNNININNQNNDIIIENNNEQNQIIDINKDIIDDESNKSVIGILGLGNVGKSYLLSLFIDQELPTGDSIHTKGISIKKIENYIILDSEGVDAALTKTNISKELYPKENLINKNINESDYLIEKISRDKKMQ